MDLHFVCLYTHPLELQLSFLLIVFDRWKNSCGSYFQSFYRKFHKWSAADFYLRTSGMLFIAIYPGMLQVRLYSFFLLSFISFSSFLLFDFWNVRGDQYCCFFWRHRQKLVENRNSCVFSTPKLNSKNWEGRNMRCLCWMYLVLITAIFFRSRSCESPRVALSILSASTSQESPVWMHSLHPSSALLRSIWDGVFSSSVALCFCVSLLVCRYVYRILFLFYLSFFVSTFFESKKRQRLVSLWSMYIW